MAATGDSEGKEFFKHNNSSETLSEGRDQDVEERLIPDIWNHRPAMGPPMVSTAMSAPVMIPVPTSMVRRT